MNGGKKMLIFNLPECRFILPGIKIVSEIVFLFKDYPVSLFYWLSYPFQDEENAVIGLDNIFNYWKSTIQPFKIRMVIFCSENVGKRIAVQTHSVVDPDPYSEKEPDAHNLK